MSEFAIHNLPVARLRRYSLMVGGVFIVAVIIGWIFQPTQFYRSYLFAWLFWLGTSLGALGVVSLHHLLGGRWGACTRRLAENAMWGLVPLIILFIPIAIGVYSLFDWAKPEQLEMDPILRHERPYLNWGFFVGRAIIYFALWAWLVWSLRRDSLRFAITGDGKYVSRAHAISGFTQLALFLSMTMASVDWLQSREPHWFSTVFGLTTVMGQGITGLCFVLIMTLLLRDQEPISEVITQDQLNDLGNILLTFVILWTYLTFCQLLVIWMGNKQDEIPWYVARFSNGWWWIGVGILILHFVVPFLVLLLREAKRAPTKFLYLVVLLFAMRAVDLFWEVTPSGLGARPLLHQTISWMDIVLPIGMGGIWFAWFLWLTERAPLLIRVPQFDLPAETHGAGA